MPEDSAHIFLFSNTGYQKANEHTSLNLANRIFFKEVLKSSLSIYSRTICYF